MTVRFLMDHNLVLFLDRLRLCGELHAPLLGADGIVRFAPLYPDKLPDLSARRTMLPVKKYLLQPQETILNYTAENSYELPLAETSELILFGIHPCDLAGINYLDRLFLGNDPDPLYAARRSMITLVGVSCTPDEYCSCHQLRSPLAPISDLFLQIAAGGYVVTSASPRGDALMESARELLEERELDLPEDTRCFFCQSRPEIPPPEVDANLPEWQEFAARCLGCGACSICCPTCYCFDVLEFSGLDGSSAERVRQWDNCLFKSHSQVAGGMSFNKDRAERFRYRYRHKYRGFGALQGIASCVGCGRCRVVCPTEIDLRPLAKRLEGGEYAQ